MAEAVYHCHENSVVHRDLKLENFLIDINEHTGELEVKLCDFGLAKKILPGHKRKGKAGTLVTMAPEMIVCGFYDQKVDAWSLGVILFELLTNTIPFLHKNNQVLEHMICELDINFKQVQVEYGLSAEAVDLISKLMRKDPVARIDIEEILKHPWLLADN